MGLGRPPHGVIREEFDDPFFEFPSGSSGSMVLKSYSAATSRMALTASSPRPARLKAAMALIASMRRSGLSSSFQRSAPLFECFAVVEERGLFCLGLSRCYLRGDGNSEGACFWNALNSHFIAFFPVLFFNRFQFVWIDVSWELFQQLQAFHLNWSDVAIDGLLFAAGPVGDRDRRGGGHWLAGDGGRRQVGRDVVHLLQLNDVRHGSRRDGKAARAGVAIENKDVRWDATHLKLLGERWFVVGVDGDRDEMLVDEFHHLLIGQHVVDESLARFGVVGEEVNDHRLARLAGLFQGVGECLGILGGGGGEVEVTAQVGTEIAGGNGGGVGIGGRLWRRFHCGEEGVDDGLEEDAVFLGVASVEIEFHDFAVAGECGAEAIAEPLDGVGPLPIDHVAGGATLTPLSTRSGF